VAERAFVGAIYFPLSALGGGEGRGEVGDAGAAMIVQAILFYIFAAVAVASGVLSIGFGCFLSYQIGVVNGLLTSHPHWTPRRFAI